MARQQIPYSLIKWMLLLADVAVLFLVFNLSYYLRLKGVHPELLLTKEFLYIITLVLTCSYVFDLYDPNSQISGLRTPGRFLIATVVSGGLVALLVYALGEPVSHQFGRSIMLGTFAFFGAWGALGRLALGKWLKKRNKALRWLVVGECKFLTQFHKDFEGSRTEGSVSYLVKESQDERDQECAALPILGDWAELEHYLNKGWSGIVVCSSSPLPDTMIEKLLESRLHGTRVFNVTDFYEGQWLKVPIYFLDHSWILLSQGFGLLHNPIGLRLKRIFDILGSALLLPVVIPVFLLGALLIFLESGFPVIYRQVRTGKDGRTFRIFKLRTMNKDAEMDGVKWTEKNDRRVLRSGRLLRKFRMDELPQILNVLKGDMSFIGPRPERPEIISNLESVIPHYQLRHVVVPGITGWAQVLYDYGASVEDAKEKLQYDLYYIKNYTLIMDVAIIFKTLRTLLFGAGR